MSLFHQKLFDPITGRVLSQLCWDGMHHQLTRDEFGKVQVGCTGHMVEGEAQPFEDTRCYCACHDPRPKRPKKQKCESLPLPGGTITV